MITDLPTDLTIITRYLAAIALGLLMGLERERDPNARAGLRTFALTALFGVLAAQLADKTGATWLIVSGLLITGGMIIAAYLRQPAENTDPGTTTISALLICYGLGVLCWYNELQLAATLGIASTVLLYFKAELRGISQTLTRRDLISILQFAVLSLIVLPLLPNQNYGPYGALNPYHIWLMVVLISGISLAGYAALRIAGERRGTVLIGLLGGLVSSTATTLTFSRFYKASGGDNSAMRVSTIVIVLANLVVLVRLVIVVGVLSQTIFIKLLPILLSGLVVGILASWYGLQRMKPDSEVPKLSLTNPTEFRSALTFGSLYMLVLVATAWLSAHIGSRGVIAIAVVAGLTDVDAITLSSLRLFGTGELQISQAITAIVLAFLSNLLFKSILVLTIGGWKMARHAIAGMSAIGIGLCIGWLLF